MGWPEGLWDGGGVEVGEKLAHLNVCSGLGLKLGEDGAASEAWDELKPTPDGEEGSDVRVRAVVIFFIRAWGLGR
jgi:hypothetical protein